MRMEWLRASDNFPACWACFVVYDDRVDVLAITGSKQRIDHTISSDEARKLWADLCECGWHRASEEEIIRASDVPSKIAFNRLQRSILISRAAGIEPSIAILRSYSQRVRRAYCVST
jgi:hypothetical protein